MTTPLRRQAPPVEYEMMTTSMRNDTESEMEHLTSTTKIINAIQFLEEKALENGRITKAYFHRLKMVEFGCLVISLIPTGLSVIQYDLEFSEDDTEKLASDTLLYLIFFTSLLLAVMTVVRYIFAMEFEIKRRVIAANSTLISTGEWKNMLVEIGIVMIIPYPWLAGIRVYTKSLYDQQEIFYHVNEIIQIFSMLRIMVVIRVILLTTVWNSNRAQRICQMYAVKSGALFTLKCLMKTRPFTIIFGIYIASIPYFGYMLRIAERPMDRVNSSFSFNYQNAMWNVIITMTTVGYGDYYARTLLGRMLIFCVCIWGTTIVSLMVVTLTNVLSMSSLESKAFIVIARILCKEEVKNHAASVLTNLFRAYYITKKTGIIPVKNTENLNKHLKAFTTTLRSYKELGSQDNGFEEMDRQFDLIKQQVREINQQQTYIVESNKQIMKFLQMDPTLIEKLEEHLKSPTRSKNRFKNAEDTFISSDDDNDDEDGDTDARKNAVPIYGSINENPGVDAQSKI